MKQHWNEEAKDPLENCQYFKGMVRTVSVPVQKPRADRSSLHGRFLSIMYKCIQCINFAIILLQNMYINWSSQLTKTIWDEGTKEPDVHMIQLIIISGRKRRKFSLQTFLFIRLCSNVQCIHIFLKQFIEYSVWCSHFLQLLFSFVSLQTFTNHHF